MRHFGHDGMMRPDRPDSVNDPFEEKLTLFQRIILGVGIVGGTVLGVGVAHGYYLWFLR